MERRLAAVFAADVVGYSRLIRADEEGTLAAFNALRTDLIDPKIAEHNGRIVKLMGDGVLAEFGSVVDAVRAATEFQRTMADRNTDIAEDKRIEFRVGINLGDVVIDGDDIHGDGVNIAARLERLAEPGGICISGGVYEQVRNQIATAFEDMGDQQVKNIAEPIRAYRVRLDSDYDDGKTVGKVPRSIRWRWAVPAAILLVLAVAAVLVWFWPRPEPREPVAEDPAMVPGVAQPTRHFKVRNPAKLAGAEALTVYDRIRDAMAEMYARSDRPYAKTYQTWRQYNSAPYRSATHGRRFVNNYANPTARAYGKFPNAGILPVGSVLVKDSFEVTARGDVLSGPLAIMEKMPAGFNPASRDWRYTQIMPSGEIFGVTNGANSLRVAFCIGCHRSAGEAKDHIFFVPRKYRVHFFEPANAAE